MLSAIFLQATSIAEVLCLTVFFGRLVHFAKVTPQMVFWKDTKNICIMVTIVVSVSVVPGGRVFVIRGRNQQDKDLSFC
jgi:hypothetical protein